MWHVLRGRCRGSERDEAGFQITKLHFVDHHIDHRHPGVVADPAGASSDAGTRSFSKLRSRCCCSDLLSREFRPPRLPRTAREVWEFHRQPTFGDGLSRERHHRAGHSVHERQRHAAPLLHGPDEQ